MAGGAPPPPAAAEADVRHMAAACALARRAEGRVWPNPAVGCVLVRDGRVVGRGWTRPGGRPHAETEALARAGDAARGATAYVSLEPCSHHGKTPPCADALVEAGVARVVTAMEDPDPRVQGRGHDRLRAAGITVDTHVGAAEAEAINHGFVLRHRDGRPAITLKLATTLDGRIAAHSGRSRWITGEDARRAVHALRARHDAVLVGSGTAIADDPALTCRLPGLADRAPVRIVMDRRLRLPLTASLVATARETPTWLITLAGGDAARITAFRDAGVEVIEVAAGDRTGLPDIDVALQELGRRGLNTVLVEGGAHLAAALLRADRVDRLHWVTAPAVMGGDGTAAVMPFGIDDPDAMPRFEGGSLSRVGPDIWQAFARPASPSALPSTLPATLPPTASD
jgi:diaminohydroxyphosphoribosylaminopyrimidine deaminase/5-amino-6-(5-phosphoribosylamino)uracil reductase